MVIVLLRFLSSKVYYNGGISVAVPLHLFILFSKKERGSAGTSAPASDSRGSSFDPRWVGNFLGPKMLH